MGRSFYLRPDVHMHSVFSDGTDTPGQLLNHVREAGLDLFSLTDHDTTEGCHVVQQLRSPGDPRFICGVEFSCTDPKGKYHMLGYFNHVDKRPIREMVEFAHSIRMQKQENRFRYLQENFGFSFTESEKASIMNLKNPGRPHFAALMLEKGYINTKSEGFEIFKDYHGKEPYLPPEAAIDAILKSDGIPVLAHGVLADGSKNLSDEEIHGRVERFKKAGLMGVECYYSTFTSQQKWIMLSLAEEFDLFVTAGSDYHGTNKAVHLGQTNDPDLDHLRRFYDAIDHLL